MLLQLPGTALALQSYIDVVNEIERRFNNDAHHMAEEIERMLYSMSPILEVYQQEVRQGIRDVPVRNLQLLEALDQRHSDVLDRVDGYLRRRKRNGIAVNA